MKKDLKVRIQHKMGTTADWEKANENSDFTPYRGEFIVYSDGIDGTSTTPAIKVGDGTSKVSALPFVTGGSSLPKVSEEDNDKFLRVVDGKWAAVELETYDGEVE